MAEEAMPDGGTEASGHHRAKDRTTDRRLVGGVCLTLHLAGRIGSAGQLIGLERA